MTMVALFHGVPLIIDLIWNVWKKYVTAAVEHYRYRRSIGTIPDPTDGALGVESAMPHISSPNTKTQSGKPSIKTGEKTGANG